MAWQYSRLGFTGLVASLQAHETWPRVHARLNAPLAQHVAQPEKYPWVEGVLVEELSQVIFEEGGHAAVEDVYFRHVNHRVGGLMIPFVKVALAIARNDPRAFLTRMNVSLAPVSKGLSSDWKEHSATSGVICVSHGGRRPPPQSEGSWQGILKFGFMLCGKQQLLRCKSSPLSSGPTSLDFHLDWG